MDQTELPVITEPTDAVSTAKLIGELLWTLTGRSIVRLIIVFLSVFVASSVVTFLLIGWLYAESTGWSRTGVSVFVLLLLVPASALASFNFATYSVLRDIVEKLAVGQKIGEAFVTKLSASGVTTLPIPQFRDALAAFTKQTHAEASTELRGVRGWFARQADRVLMFAVRLVINRLAAGCVTDGGVDLAQLGPKVGERVDSMVINYLRKVLWDLTRLVLSVGMLVLWLLLYVLSFVL